MIIDGESSYLKCWWISQREREEEGHSAKNWAGGLGMGLFVSMIHCSWLEEWIPWENGCMRSSKSTLKTETWTLWSWTTLLPWKAFLCFLYRKTSIYGEVNRSPSRKTPFRSTQTGCCTLTGFGLTPSNRKGKCLLPVLTTFQFPFQTSTLSFLLGTTTRSSSTTGIYSTSKLLSGENSSPLLR